MNLALPAFGQKTAVGRNLQNILVFYNLHVSGRVFALGPLPWGIRTLCVKLRGLGDVRVRWFSYHPPCLTDLALPRARARELQEECGQNESMDATLKVR